MSNAGAETIRAVELAFTYTEDEYTEAARAFYARASDPKFAFYLGVGVVLAGLLLSWVAGDPYFGGAMLFAVLIVLARWLYGRWAMRSLFRRNPKFRDEYRLTFSDEGIIFRSKSVESRLGWEFYTGLWETPDFYYLIYGEDMFSLIPKRAFRTPLREAAFRELLRRKLEPKTGAPPPELKSRADEYVPPAEPPDWR